MGRGIGAAGLPNLGDLKRGNNQEAMMGAFIGQAMMFLQNINALIYLNYRENRTKNALHMLEIAGETDLISDEMKDKIVEVIGGWSGNEPNISEPTEDQASVAQG